jgi:GNAT superfamily N-acetyltransferase
MLTYGVSLWLASKSDTAVAYASCDQNPSNPEKTLEIHQLYVRAAARGHGIARKMLTHILQQARSDGYVKATTMIADHDPIAVALARGIGFHLEHNAEEYVCRISLEELLPSRA